MTGTPWLDLETRWFFEDNIEELRKRPILNINKTKDAPPDWPYLMGLPMTCLDKYQRERAQLVDIVRWHVNGKYKYCRIIIRWRDGYLADDRDPDEIQDIYEHFDEAFLEKWYDEAMDPSIVDVLEGTIFEGCV